MERFDVVLMGLDPERAPAEVVAVVARHLGSSTAEIEHALASAPATLVADVSELDARRLVTDLRELGARVKPRAAGSAMPSSSATQPPPRARSSEAPRTVGSGRSPLEEIELASLPPSEGRLLELDLPPRAPSVAPRSASERPLPLREAPESRMPLRVEPEREERPRVFFRALPEAFLVPFRGHSLYGLLAAPIVGVGGIVIGAVGLRLSILSLVVALVFAFAYVGILLQVSRRCLWAAAVGERAPDPLPQDYVSDYLFTGAGVVIAQGILGVVSGVLLFQLARLGAHRLVVDLVWLFLALYGVIGFALSAANGSATGYLDVARIVRILVKAPVHVLTIAVVGAVLQGGAIFLASLQIVAGMASGNPLTMFLSIGVVGLFVSFAAAYGVALSATMMGMLFYAKPDVAT